MKEKTLLPLALMLVFALSRIPGVLPENFSAAYALAFCGGLYFSRGMAWWLPLGTLLMTDILLNIFCYHQAAFNGYMLINLLAFAGIVGLGRWFKPGMNWLKLLGGGVLGAVFFYLVTNTAAWLWDPGYPKTLAGLWQALTVGLPGFPPTWVFFLKTLFSGGLFTALFVGSMKLTAPAESKAEQEAPEPESDEEEAPEQGGARANAG